MRPIHRQRVVTGGDLLSFTRLVAAADSRGRAALADFPTDQQRLGAGPVHDFDDATNAFRVLGVPYLELLSALHTHLTPRTYLEVGTETGASLALVGCDAVAVDPQFQLKEPPPVTAPAHSSFK